MKCKLFGTKPERSFPLLIEIYYYVIKWCWEYHEIICGQWGSFRENDSKNTLIIRIRKGWNLWDTSGGKYSWRIWSSSALFKARQGGETSESPDIFLYIFVKKNNILSNFYVICICCSIPTGDNVAIHKNKCCMLACSRSYVIRNIEILSASHFN